MSPLQALTRAARAFVYKNADRIDEFLRPSLREMMDDLRSREGDVAAVLLENFRKSNYAWEMYFWACLADRLEALPLEDALTRTSDDIMGLGDLLDTRLVVETDEDPTEIAAA